MAGLQRYVEWMSRGRRTDRVAYVTKEWNLPVPLPGAEWQRDEKFNAAEALLGDPQMKNVFKKAIHEGIALTDLAAKTRSSSTEDRGAPD